ncbi:MAG: response regulator transcription factor [Nocardioidaceae bacterium]
MPSSTCGPSGASRKVRVLIADDHELIRVGLARLVSSQPDLTVVGMAADGQEAVLISALEHPDVVVMDLSMPLLDGVGATREIASVSPGSKVLVLSSYVERSVIASAVAAGACGYLVKDVSALEVLEAVRRTHRGEAVFSAGVRP